MNPQIIRMSWRISKILHVDWSANFSMDELRKKEVANEIASLISSLNLGSEEMSDEEHLQLVGEEIVKQRTSWLSWWIWHGVQYQIWVQI